MKETSNSPSRLDDLEHIVFETELEAVNGAVLRGDLTNVLRSREGDLATRGDSNEL